jgi:hypothetical protein
MVRVVEIARDSLNLTVNIYIHKYIKEGSVCWYDGLSCKLSSNALSKVRVLFFLLLENKVSFFFNKQTKKMDTKKWIQNTIMYQLLIIIITLD